MASTTSKSGGLRRLAVAIGAALIVAACGDDGEADPVAAAQARVRSAEDAVTEAESEVADAGTEFCDEAQQYIAAIDQYGKVFSTADTTVGDLKTAGDDLAGPRRSVESSAEAVTEAHDALAEANQELTDAQAALASAQSSTTVAPSTATTVPPVDPATVDRVQVAEEELGTASEGIDDDTSIREAATSLNAAAFALEVAWLRLFADADCLTDEQQMTAVTAVTDYTASLQTSLQTAGYYDGPIDGVYGPSTVAAVEALQTDAELPVTGVVDQATAAALTAAVLAVNGDAAEEAVVHTAAVQATLKLAGYWPGDVDGEWTPELTEALQAFQEELGVEPSGEVDPATLHALQVAISEARGTPDATTTTEAEDDSTTTSEGTTTTAP